MMNIKCRVFLTHGVLCRLQSAGVRRYEQECQLSQTNRAPAAVAVHRANRSTRNQNVKCDVTKILTKSSNSNVKQSTSAGYYKRLTTCL